MIRNILAAGALAVVASATLAPAPAHAGDSCGWFAFADAYKSRSRANNRANRIGGYAWSVDASNSPNAGQGWWAVGVGPTSRGAARAQVRRWKARGVKSYAARRCFYGE